MEGFQQQGSEVARLLKHIQDEYESAVAGVKGLAYCPFRSKTTHLDVWDVTERLLKKSNRNGEE